MNSLRDFNTFFKNIITMGGSYSDPALPTTKHERILDLPTLSYKKNSLFILSENELLFICKNGWIKNIKFNILVIVHIFDE